MSHKAEEKPAEVKKKSCFIAMPISTPEQWRPVYGNDAEHFKHVLECLFIPAITIAGLHPIPPISRGSDVIHADIIRQLESADLVLIDMTTLNANVFFEFGIRVAMDKPICLIKDDKTFNVPFDAGLINHYTYSAALNLWECERQIETLATHISHAVTPKMNSLSLWKSFSLGARAHVVDPGTVTIDQKLAHLSDQVGKITQSIALESVRDPTMIKADEGRRFSLVLNRDFLFQFTTVMRYLDSLKYIRLIDFHVAPSSDAPQVFICYITSSPPDLVLSSIREYLKTIDLRYTITLLP